MKLKVYDTECIRVSHAVLVTDPWQHITTGALALEVGLNRTKIVQIDKMVLIILRVQHPQAGSEVR